MTWSRLSAQFAVSPGTVPPPRGFGSTGACHSHPPLCYERNEPAASSKTAAGKRTPGVKNGSADESNRIDYNPNGQNRADGRRAD